MAQRQPLTPVFAPSAKGDARKLVVSGESARKGVLFVLQTAIPWKDLPQSLGCGSCLTWWQRLWEGDQIEWSRTSIDGSSAPSSGAGIRGQPHGSRQTRLQTTHHRRCQRHPAGDPRQRTIASRIARRGIKSSERLASNAEWLRERTAGLPTLKSYASALKGTWTSTKHYRVLCCSDHLRALRGEGVLAALNVQAIYFDSCWLLIGLDSKPSRP